MRTVTIPPLAASIIKALGTKALTAAATLLVGYGILPAPQSDQFVTVGTGLLLGLVSLGLTVLKERANHQTKIDLATAPAATAITPAGKVLGTPDVG